MKFTEQQIENARLYPIHNLVGVPYNGREKKICCPFHGEKTPSFALYADGHYHCYGCGKHGANAIDFVMQLTDCSFVEAIEALLET